AGLRSIQNITHRVGPDLRLEPTPALDKLTPAERAKLLADPLNPPGTMWKVGPSLRRIDEKANPAWAVRWIRAPRDFRPDTKMPPFYGLSNNRPEILAAAPDDATREQKKFPDAEVHSIVHYLFQKSRDFLAGAEKHRKDDADTITKERERYDKLKAQTSITDDEKAEMDQILRRMQMRAAPPLIAESALPPAAKDQAAYIAEGRKLFSERGCLACHSHSAM